MNQTLWFERKFGSIDDNGLFPNILERLQGTPVRVHALFLGASANKLISAESDKWSPKEELGHLLDLEPLWLGRFHDFANKEEVLREADLQNRKTHQANHNAKPLTELIQAFQVERNKVLEYLSLIEPEYLEVESLHPRLKKPMRPIDLAFFIAEHDDHHLARIRGSLRLG